MYAISACMVYVGMCLCVDVSVYGWYVWMCDIILFLLAYTANIWL